MKKLCSHSKTVENSLHSRAWAPEQVRSLRLYVDAISSFILKMWIKGVEGNKEIVIVSYRRHLCFGVEDKMRFSREKEIIYRLKIRSKAAIIVEVKEDEVDEGVKIPRVDNRRTVRPGDINFVVPYLNIDSEAGVRF